MKTKKKYVGKKEGEKEESGKRAKREHTIDLKNISYEGMI